MVQRGSTAVSIRTDSRFQRWRRGNLRLVEDWTTEGLLQEIDPDKAQDVVEAERFSLVTCSDCDQVFVDILPHLRDWLLTERIHTFSCHGGGLMLDPNFAYHQQVRDVSTYWLNEVGEAFSDGISTCYLLTHVPCKRAWRFGLSARDQVRSLIAAKDRLKTEIPGLKVGCLMQIDRGESCTDRKRRVTRMFRARDFRQMFSLHRPDFAGALS